MSTTPPIAAVVGEHPVDEAEVIRALIRAATAQEKASAAITAVLEEMKSCRQAMEISTTLHKAALDRQERLDGQKQAWLTKLFEQVKQPMSLVLLALAAALAGALGVERILPAEAHPEAHPEHASVED